MLMTSPTLCGLAAVCSSTCVGNPMSFRGVTRPMRSLPVAVVLVALVGAASGPRSAAIETGPSRPAKASPMLGVSYGSQRGARSPGSSR